MSKPAKPAAPAAAPAVESGAAPVESPVVAAAPVTGPVSYPAAFNLPPTGPPFRAPRVPSLRATLYAALRAGVPLGTAKGKNLYPGLVAVLENWALALATGARTPGGATRLAVEAVRIARNRYGYGFKTVNGTLYLIEK